MKGKKKKKKISSLILSIPIMRVWRRGVQDFQWWLNLDLVRESTTLQDGQEEDKEWKRTVGHGDAEQCFDTCLKQLEQQKATQINLMLLHNVNTADQRRDINKQNQKQQKTATHQPTFSSKTLTSTFQKSLYIVVNSCKSWFHSPSDPNQSV